MFRIPLPWPDTALLVAPPWSHLPAWLRIFLLLTVVVVPLVLLVTLYRYELRLVPRLTALGLLGLRLAAVAVVLGLVCLQPIYARDRWYEIPGKVIIAVDRSASMDVADRQRDPAEKLRLARALGLSRDLAADDVVEQWATAHARGQGPRWLPADADRRKAHDQILARVDTLTRSATAKRILGDEGLKLLSAVAAKHTVELWPFHREAWELKPSQFDDLFREAAGGSGSGAAFTDLRAPLVRALERSGQGGVLGVVVLTDGQHNAGPPPTEKARELGERKVPVYPVALGALRPPPDVAVVAVRGPNHTVFKDVEAVIEVKFKVTGLKAQDFLVELHREGKEKKKLAERTVTHDGKDRVYTESFPVKVDEVGTQRIIATVRPVVPDAEETRQDNNRLATTLSVADDRARVLLVDGEARWEFHYLATALQRDRLVELKQVVFEQPRLNERVDDPEKLGLPLQKLPEGADALAGYQCIILGDVDPARLPLAERQRLERYVADSGGTLIIVAGKRFMPLAYPPSGPGGDSDPLRRLLPIEQPRLLAPQAGFAMALTQGGRDARFMELDPDPAVNARLWAGFPRPWGWAVAGTAKPGATPLAHWPAPAEAKRPPSERDKRHVVFARHSYGFGRVLYVGVDSTWRWRYKVGDAYHHRFWGQVLRWAAADRALVAGNQWVRFGTPQPVYRPGEAVEVVARLNDALGPLKPDLLAGARVVRLGEGDKDAERAVALVQLTRRPGQPRVLEGRVRDLPAGNYAIELAIPDLADRLKPDADAKGARSMRAPFAVLPPESREMVDLETNRPLLDEVAALSGGRVFTPEDVAGLKELLTTRGVPQAEHHEQRLWQWWGMLAVVVALLTLEWAGRKLAGLP